MNPFQNPEIDATESLVPAPQAPLSELDVLRKELEGQKVISQGLFADFESFRRRSRQEAESRAAAQKESFIKELLPVIDNLERALASGADAGSQQLYHGVEMTLQQLRQLLSQHGIEPDECVGAPFDPRRHDAIAQGRDLAHPDQAILVVHQRGYRRGEDVLRAAKVVVNDLTHPKRAHHVH